MAKSEKNAPRVFAVVMAGGKGRRFWPKSREDRPKQLLAIGTDKPLLKETVERLRPIMPVKNVLVSSGRDLAVPVMETVPEVPPENFILEPVGRNTAPCIGLSLEYASARSDMPDEDTVVAILPADHWIKSPKKFQATLKKAIKTAHREKLIVTIGIVPESPSEAYGYIRPGKTLREKDLLFQAKNFVEKPDRRTAKRYMKDGYLWNAGMFIARLDVLRDAYKAHLPKMAKQLAALGEKIGEKGEADLVAREFPKMENVSIDYGVMEKCDNVAVIKADFGWCDVGGWDALYRLMGGDGDRNVVRGEAYFSDAKGCYVESDKMVAVVGVDDLAVIDTGDALLVVPREKEGDIKKLIDILEKKGKKEVL